MLKVVLMVLMATFMHAGTASYSVKFQGITLGEIETLETLKSGYLKATVTNAIAKLLIGKQYFIFHEGDAPKISDAKFRKDKNMVLFALLQSMQEKPKAKTYPISDTKRLTIACEAAECTFEYYKVEEIKGRGRVIFDSKGDFLKLTEEISSVEISKN